MPNWWPANIIVEGVRPWLWVPRREPIRLVIIHATRGGSRSKETEFRGTINWVKSPGNNQGGWGGSASSLIAGDGQLAIILPDNHQPTWSAGYGGPGTWAIDVYAKSYELAQPHEDDPFTDAQYERLAFEVAKDHIAYGIEPVMLPFLEQTGSVPSGITRHDTCANGRAYGKSDPGRLFDEGRFIGLLTERIAELKEGDMATVAERIAYREGLALEIDHIHKILECAEELRSDKDELITRWPSDSSEGTPDHVVFQSLSDTYDRIQLHLDRAKKRTQILGRAD